MGTLIVIETLKPWNGEPLPQTIDTAVIQFQDGRTREVNVSEIGEKPYPILVRHAPDALDTWSDEELRERAGLMRPTPAIIPEGMVAIGAPRYKRQNDDSIIEVRDIISKPASTDDGG